MQPVLDEAFICGTMDAFARDSGLSSHGVRPQRYLWTDAFAVCNYLELFRHTNNRKYLQLVLDLVAQVHEILGKHRDDNLRVGWISGLGEDEGRMHPTAGGLRIGKPLPDRKPNQHPNDPEEWNRDGQYYHYLTKWMHALHQVEIATSDRVFSRWACELAKTAHNAFVYQPSSETAKRMYWKMGIDLTYPVVASMGQHDPLDGFVTYTELQQLTRRHGHVDPKLDLTVEIAELAQLCQQMNWTTDDPLGIGGLLFDACRILQLSAGDEEFDHHGLLPLLLQSSLEGLTAFLDSGSLSMSAKSRLAFRELGLSIGLHAVPQMVEIIQNNKRLAADSNVPALLERLTRVVPVAHGIETYWLRPERRKSASWLDHANINTVMLVTSLAPAGFLTL